MINWTIWYEDGSTFSSEDGLPWESPPWGVVVITQEVPGMEVLDLGLAHYIWRADYGHWMNVDDTGLLDHIVNGAPNVLCVRPGRYITPVKWDPINRRAREARRR